MNAIPRTEREQRPINDTEVTFGAEQTLVSTTDDRGVITYANKVFSDVCGYDRQTLVKAPHKIVRHPDMPRGAFYLVWDRLKRRKPVCAYVKNRTKEGGFYWVFAVVTPMDEGFLSVRIKPQTAYFEAAKGLYAELLKQEAEEDLSPEASARELRRKLAKAGFSTYLDFMAKALDAEFLHRAGVLGQKTVTFDAIETLAELVEGMGSLVSDITQGFVTVRGEPVNLRILAGRLEGAGEALGTISQNYDAMARDMSTLVETLRSDGDGALSGMTRAIINGRSALQVAKVMKDAAAEVLEREGPSSEGGAILLEHRERLKQVGQAAMSEITATSQPIPDICRRVRRRINGLDVVKLLCKVESGRLRNRDSGLDGIISRLQKFHSHTDNQLAELLIKASQIKQKSARL